MLKFPGNFSGGHAMSQQLYQRFECVLHKIISVLGSSLLFVTLETYVVYFALAYIISKYQKISNLPNKTL